MYDAHEPDERGNFEVKPVETFFKVHASEDGTDYDKAGRTNHHLEHHVKLRDEISARVNEELEDYDKGDHKVEGRTFRQLSAQIVALSTKFAAIRI